MYHPPKLNYSGLTVILSDLGRHDRSYLLEGYSGQYFWNCLLPIDRLSCDIRLADNPKACLPGTKVVILLGPKACSLVTQERLDIIHGYPFIQNGIIYIPTFAPQDAYDLQNYFGEEEDEGKDSGDEKTTGRTRRENWRFWLKKDLEKASRILSKGLETSVFLDPIIYPVADQLIDDLSSHKNDTLILDIETDKNQKITCFGFIFLSTSLVRVIPIRLYDGKYAYEDKDLHRIFQALAIAFRDNEVCGHNIMFDLFVLACRYKIPFPKKIYDTMLAFHRCYPEVEKNLGRLISLFLDFPYHKSQGGYDPHNTTQQQSLWEYNAKDVWTTKLIYTQLLREAVRCKAVESVKQVNDSIRPYLTIMMQGMRIDTEKLKEKYAYYRKLQVQLERCLAIIVGFPLNPRSSKQVSRYLFESLQLEKPHKDPTNEKQLLKLLIKKNIPSIKLILAIRKAGKLASALKFTLWGKDRVTCSYQLAGTTTFRLGSKALFKFRNFKGYGTNLQNWT